MPDDAGRIAPYVLLEFWADRLNIPRDIEGLPRVRAHEPIGSHPSCSYLLTFAAKLLHMVGSSAWAGHRRSLKIAPQTGADLVTFSAEVLGCGRPRRIIACDDIKYAISNQKQGDVHEICFFREPSRAPLTGRPSSLSKEGLVPTYGNADGGQKSN
jgi:hypothetical protein